MRYIIEATLMLVTVGAMLLMFVFIALAFSRLPLSLVLLVLAVLMLAGVLKLMETLLGGVG
jgi:hypothetical protein